VIWGRVDGSFILRLNFGEARHFEESSLVASGKPLQMEFIINLVNFFLRMEIEGRVI